MDIYIGVDNKELDKFKTMARKMAERIEDEKIGNPKSIKEYTIRKKGLCMLFSNNIKYIEKIVKETSCDVINVTDNLSSAYIVETLKYVKDIYYLKADLSTLMDRLKTRIKIMENNIKVI